MANNYNVRIGDIGNNNFIIVGDKVKVVSDKRINTPVPRNKLSKFVALVTIKTMEYEENPANPPSIEGDLRFFLDETIDFSSYQNQKPLEVAMLYRLYSSIYLLMEVSTNNNWDKAFQDVKNILKYSVQLFEENLNNKLYDSETYYQKIIDKFSQFKDSVEQLEKIFESFDSNRITPEIFKEITFHNLVLAMPTKELSLIKSRADIIGKGVVGYKGKGGVIENTPHFKFLIHLKNSHHQQLGDAIKLLEQVLTVRNEDDIHYPKNPVNPYYYLNKENGLCRIEYDYKDDGNHIKFYWDVFADRRILNPISSYAKLLTEYWSRNFISLESIKIILDKHEPSELLNFSKTDFTNKNFNSSILKLMKLKIISDTNPEIHYHLGISLYGAMLKFSPSPKMLELMQKMKDLQRLPANERDKKFQEFLKTTDQGAFQELNRVMTNEYPFWIRNEFTEYLNKEPNGKYAAQVRQLLTKFSNILPKN